ncbi:MAG: ABC transporter substrate-binding protein [Rubrivivax sp.]|jgi:branched-chain amino acid transport system substrate-binding protein|nr:ABC transporter substrate-binding protein [Rubrivivax sp.]
MSHRPPTRRRLLQGGAALAGAGALGAPALLLAQSGPIKIGHLTPMTGFLGALGEYAVQGMRMAVEELNAAGGVNGRPFELLTEDSVNPQVASSKAQRMIERDGVALLCGEISSASALTISQVAARNRKLFLSIGARSDTLRGKDCNRYTFHVDIPVTVMVKAVGQALLRDKLVQGKKIFSLTSDYLFGHDLAKVAKAFYAANGATSVGDELVATDLTDFSPFLLKIRQARPDVVSTNLGGNQVTNFVKQYAEFGLPYPVVGFNLNTADAWAAGEGNLGGIWPTVWHHELKTPGTQAFVAAFQKKYNRLPENHAWIEYVSMKILAQAMRETRGAETDKLIAYFESEAKFDLLKSRPGYFRAWDHQLMQEAYPFTVKPKGQAKHKQDFLLFGEPVPGPNEPLELLAPTKAENTCNMA